MCRHILCLHARQILTPVDTNNKILAEKIQFRGGTKPERIESQSLQTLVFATHLLGYVPCHIDMALKFIHPDFSHPQCISPDMSS